MRQRVSGKSEAERQENSLNRRKFLKLTAGASAAACLPTMDAEAALPEARITAIRIYEGPSEIHRWFIARDLLRNGLPAD